MPFPSLTFADLSEWQAWVNNNIIPNGMELITGDDGNITENAAIYFITRSPLNWQTADIASTGGSINANRPITVIMSLTPTLLTWADNIYNEYVFINTTLGDVPTTQTYYDINLTAVNKIPAKSVINICKAKNGQWILKSLPASGSGVISPPYVGIVDRGRSTDPVSGTSIFQSNSLIGLGATNDGNITILYGTQPRDSYGSNQSFIYDNITGTINLDFNGSGEQWFPGAALWVDRNQ